MSWENFVTNVRPRLEVQAHHTPSPPLITLSPSPSPLPQSHTHTAAFFTHTVTLDDTTVKFEIWDTAGEERYHSLVPNYYRGAQAAIVVYDITEKVSHLLR